MKDASRQAPVSPHVPGTTSSTMANSVQRVMVWSMIFCSITSWLAALLLLWTAGNWQLYMEGM